MTAAEDPPSLLRLPKSLQITQRPANLYSGISCRPLILSRRLSSRILCHAGTPDEKQTPAGLQPPQLSQAEGREEGERGRRVPLALWVLFSFFFFFLTYEGCQ